MINCKLEHVKIRIVALVMEGNRKFVRNLTLSESPPFYPTLLLERFECRAAKTGTRLCEISRAGDSLRKCPRTTVLVDVY